MTAISGPVEKEPPLANRVVTGSVDWGVMPRYDIENTAKIGKPCRVFDANNDEVPWVVFCDTETGEVERLEHDGQTFVTNDEGDGINRITENRPSPLRIEWREPASA